MGELILSGETFPHNRTVARGLRRLGYRQIKELPRDLAPVLYNIKGVGPRRAQDFLQALAQLAEHKLDNGAVNLSQKSAGTKIGQGTDEIPISLDTFPRQRSLVRQLTGNGIAQVGQMPKDRPLDLYLQTFPSVGPKTAANFITQLAMHGQALAKVSSNTEKNFRPFWGYGDFVPLYQSMLDEPLTRLLIGTNALTTAELLESHKIINPRDLPPTVSKLRQQLPTLRPAAVKNFFVGLQIIAGSQEISPQAAFKALMDLALQLAAGQKPKGMGKRNFRLFKLRLDFLAQGERPTLQALGKEVGITRERVRQLQPLIRHQLLHNHAADLASVCQHLIAQGGFADFQSFAGQHKLKGLRAKLALAELLAIRGITYSLHHGYLSAWPQEQLKNLKHELDGFLDVRLGGQATKQPVIRSLVKEFIEKKGLLTTSLEPLYSVAKQELLYKTPSGLWARPMSQTALALKLFRREVAKHPEGLELYCALPDLLKQAKELSWKGFPSERALLGAILRNEDEVILWGWGMYVHRNQIKATAADIAPVAQWVAKQFEQGVPQLSARAAFDRFQDYLRRLDVPNEHALYSCLRLYFGDSFYQPRSPKLFPPHQKENLTNTELVINYLQNKGDQTYAALKQEFIDLRGWQEFQLQQVLNDDSDIIRTGSQRYGLLSHYEVPLQKLRSLAQSFYDCFADDLVTVSVRRLFLFHQAACLKLNIPNEYVLYGLVNAFCDDLFQTRRFPHVSLHGASDGVAQYNKTYIDEFMRHAGQPVSRTALVAEFVERRGWTERSLDNALTAAGILRLCIGCESEFVHARTINWNNAKARQLALHMRWVLQELDQRDFPFGHLEQLLTQEQLRNLPTLANGVAWTPELLRSLLANLDFVLLLGRKEYTFAANPNSAGVADYDDFIAWIIKKEFGGSVPVSRLEARLRELDFRQASLRPTAGQGDLPFEISDSIARLSSN